MKVNTMEERIHLITGLLNEAREEADGLRKRVEKYEKILLSTRLVMGHELKKPTTALSGYLELALEELKGTDHAGRGGILEIIKKARGECELLNELNIFFLELLRIESEEERLHARRIDLSGFLEKIIEHYPENLEATGRVEVCIAPGAEWIYFNPNALKLILSNLIENALIYSPGGSGVRVEVERSVDKRRMSERDIMKIKIIDNGVGIPEPSLRRIFSPFVRAHKGIADGTGLGLTLVRSLVELYGGDVCIKSVTGKGTTVFLTFPALQDTQEHVVV